VRAREPISKEDLERWEERGLIRAIPLPSGVRRVHAEGLASLPIGALTRFAPLREDHDAVRVERVGSLE
jgi:hypothetical protein